MNMPFLSRGQVEFSRSCYPPGTRIVLNSMNDPYAPVESGIRGTVRYVDDLQRIGFVAALSFVIARLNHGKPFLPRDDPFNLTEEFLFLRPHLRQFIAECGNCHLFIHKFIISHSAVFGTSFCAVLP